MWQRKGRHQVDATVSNRFGDHNDTFATRTVSTLVQGPNTTCTIYGFTN
jgi:hypothetical protein